MSHITSESPLENHGPRKRYRLKVRPLPVRVKDSIQIFALAAILGSAEASLVVWTLRGWLAVNEAKKHNFREGRFWTYNSLPQWCVQHFPWLSPKQLSTIMTRLEDQGVIIRKQFKAKHEFDNQYWYSVNEEVLAALAVGKNTPLVPPSRLVASPAQAGSSRADSVASSAQMGAPSAQTVSYTTKESSKYESSISDSNLSLSTTTALPDAAVVVQPDPAAPEAESGEHSLDGEGRDTTAVKAFVPHEQHHDERPISKVPLKVLPLGETARDLAATMMAPYERFGLTEDYAAQLIQRYGEDHVRACHCHIQDNWRQFPGGHKSRIFNPPGFMTDELAVRRLNLAPVSAAAVDLDRDTESDEFDTLIEDIAEAPIDSETVDTAIDETGFDIPISPTTSMTPRTVWSTAHHQLSLLFDRPSFDMWLKNAVLLKHVLIDEISTYTVGVPTAHAQDMLQHRYYRNIQRVVEGLQNRPVKIEFEVYVPPARRTDPYPGDGSLLRLIAHHKAAVSGTRRLSDVLQRGIEAAR